MRSFLLVVASAFLLAMGFLAYYWLEQPSQSHTRQGISTSRPKVAELVETPGGGMVGPGENTWLNEFSSETGNVSSRFRTQSFVRLPDGRFSVQGPIAEFWTWSGPKLVRIIRIEGASGIVTTTHRKQEPNPLKSKQMGSPSSGELHDVTVRIVEPEATGQIIDEGLPQELREALTITMHNAWFDNETFTIYTPGYTDEETGETVPKDMVPVHGVGDENHPDFDGRGLTIKWNDRDRRLDLLQLMHGQRLVIKNAKNFMQTPAPQPAALAPHKPGWGPMLASAAPDAAADAMPDDEPTPRRRRAHMGDDESTTNPATQEAPLTGRAARHVHIDEDIIKITPNTAPPLYCAKFFDNVRIVQGDQNVISGVDPNSGIDRMFVDFMLDQGQPTTRPTTQPTTHPAAPAAAAAEPAGPARDANAAARPTPPPVATATAATEPAGPAPDVDAAAQPTTRQRREKSNPSDQPVTVYWTGQLLVTPLAAAEDIPPGQSIVRFEGNPVVARQTNAELRSTHLTYNTQDSSVIAQATPQQGVIMTSVDERGDKSVIHTQELNYWRLRQMAILRGKGWADMPSPNQQAPLKADWTRSCTLNFTELQEGHSVINHVALDGDVHVNHPQIKLNAEQLDLSFDPPSVPALAAANEPATRPGDHSSMQQSNLRQLIATGKSHCELTGADQKTQIIDSNRLTVQMVAGEGGKRVPHTINADGDVHTVDADQDMHSGALAIELRPATRPAARNPPATQNAQNLEVQSMTAQDHVVVVTKDSTTATCSQLLVNVVDGKSIATLVGQGGNPAKIVNKETTVTGPTIVLSREQEEMKVIGPGEMHGLQQETPGAAPRPMDVNWSESCIVNSKDNIARAFGQVHCNMYNADGSVDCADAQRVDMLLADVPPPATHPAALPAPAATHPTAPANQDASSSLALAGKKTVRQAIFYDHAKLTSTLLDASGNLLKRTDLEGDKIQYDVLPHEQTVQKRLTVFGIGRMLMEDYRSGPQAGANAGDDSGRGVTVFWWSKQLVYDDQAKTATLDGTAQSPVVIVHGPQVDKPDMHLSGERVVADLEALAVPATRPAHAGAAPATREAEGDLRFQIKLVTVTGHVDLRAHDSELNAAKMTYEPLRHLVKAYGDQRAPALMTRTQPDSRGLQPTRADELEYNVVTDELKIIHPISDIRR